MADFTFGAAGRSSAARRSHSESVFRRAPAVGALIFIGGACSSSAVGADGGAADVGRDASVDVATDAGEADASNLLCVDGQRCNAAGDSTVACGEDAGSGTEVAVQCDTGRCHLGKCGYCSNDQDCSSSTAADRQRCDCVDGTTLLVDAPLSCVIPKCLAHADCATPCAGHGGPK
jgi:hypothetical protein